MATSLHHQRPKRSTAIYAEMRHESVTLRLVNRVFSRAAIADVCRGRFDGQAATALRDLAVDGAFALEASRSSAIAALSKWLSRNYRSEYIFKNTVANNLLFGTHSPRTTALLQEFRVGRSKIDCVVVNGTVHAFEIKTGLDSPSKLAKQIRDYQAVFPLLSVIVDETDAARYEGLLRDSPVGVVALTRKDGHLSTRKPAERDVANLSTEAMMRSLRKPEYTELVRQVAGQAPDVPNAVFFASCLHAVREVPTDSLFAMWADQLRTRKLQAPSIVAAEAMRPLRHICADINPNESEAVNLTNWLASPIA